MDHVLKLKITIPLVYPCVIFKCSNDVQNVNAQLLVSLLAKFIAAQATEKSLQTFMSFDPIPACKRFFNVPLNNDDGGTQLRPRKLITAS